LWFGNLNEWRVRGGAVSCGTALITGRPWIRFPIGSLGFSIGPWVDTAYDKSQYPGYPLGGKGGRCVGLTTSPSSCTDRLEILVASNSWSPKALYRDRFYFNDRKCTEDVILKYFSIWCKELRCEDVEWMNPAQERPDSIKRRQFLALLRDCQFQSKYLLNICRRDKIVKRNGKGIPSTTIILIPKYVSSIYFVQVTRLQC